MKSLLKKIVRVLSKKAKVKKEDRCIFKWKETMMFNMSFGIQEELRTGGSTQLL